MAAPALCQVTPAQFHEVIRCVKTLVNAGEQTSEGAARAFAAGVKALNWPNVTLELAAEETVGIAEIDAALEVLAVAAPRLGKQMLEASAASICVDGTVTVDEGELLRAVSDCLGFPMPPLIVSGDVSSVASTH